ncbi:glucosaminidase domain-containing protein [Piscibacillus sp. B03]|uniref:glucosaminidase domain-containing protein n=1 Tax=Piscibacillus sp. B03 TaxID=3457430 RepID=UPI003FCE8F45
MTEGNTGQDQENEDPPSGYQVQGETFLSPELMTRFVNQINQDAPNVANYYLELGETYGIRGDIAFAQAIHETNYFRFTGVVKPEQNNYAGIGATGPNNSGASFDTPKQGVRAHIQHLYAYASTNSLPNGEKLVDPRFDMVTRGSAPTWISLNGKWAVPGNSYGQMILDIYKRMLDFSINEFNRIKQEVDEE